MVATRRRLAVAILAVVGALALLVLVSSWLVVRVWGPSLTASRIAAALTEATGQPAHVDGVALEPLLGRVRISGLTAAGKNDLRVRVERIDIAIRIESLWRRELVVGIAVQGADVHVQTGPPATEPIVFEIPDRFEIGPISARLASIGLEQSRLRFEDPPSRVALAFEGLAATARPEGGGLELSARADRVHVSLANFQATLERIAAEGRIDGARIAVRSLAVKDPRHEIAMTGSIEAPWSLKPTLAGEVKARLAAGPIAQRLGAEVTIDGSIVADLTLSGPLAAAVLAGPVSTEQLTAAGVQLRDLSGSLRLDDQAFSVTGVEGRVLGGRMRAAITIPAGRPDQTLAQLRLDDVDAAALARVNGGTLDIRGRIAFDGETRGDLARPRTLAGQLRVEGSDLSLPGELARLGAGRIRATARMAGGQATADAEARWPAATLAATARLEPDDRLRVETRTRADIGVLPGWTARDSVEVTARAEGRWPQVTLTAGVDLARPETKREAGRLDLRLDPVAGAAPHWSGSLRSRRLALPWVGVEDLLAALSVSTDAVDVARITARVAGVPLDGAGRWRWRGSGEAKLTAGPAQLGRLPGVSSDLALDGSARGQIEASFTTAGVKGTARLEAERLAVGKIALGRGTAEATLQDRRLDASMKFPERHVEISARGDLTPGQVVTARLALRSLELASLIVPARPGEPPIVRGVISAGADAAIPVDAPRDLRGRLAIDPMSVTVAGAQWSSAAAIVVRVDGQRATLEPVRLGGPAGVIAASGVIWDAGGPPLVRAKLEAHRLVALAPALGIGLDGRLQAEAELSGDAGAVAGTRARARIAGEALVLPGALAKVGQGSGQIEVQLADGVIGITRGDVSFPGLTASATGRINLDGRLALDGRATVQAGPVGTALGWSESSGTATATATLGGRSGQLEGQAHLSSERLVIAGIAVERLDVAARMRGETVRLERLTARVLGAPLRGRGEWALSGSGRAELEAGPLALDQIKTAEPLALGGALSLRAEATAERGAVKARVQAQTTDTRVAGMSFGTGTFTARVDGRRLQANLDLGERRISGSASGALEPGGAIDASVDVSTLELAPLLRHLAANRDIDLEASLAGRLTARVPWDRPAALTARARIEPIALRSRRAGLDARGRVDATWEKGALTLERAELAGSAGTAHASGTLDPAGRLDMKLEARMLLAALVAPVTEISGSAGTVTVRGQVTGTLAEPAVSGEGSITGGSVVLRGFPAPLREINARLTATPGGIRLLDATAALGSGTLRATGEAALVGRALGLYRVRITARDVPIRPIEGLDTVWNADLELSGTEGRSLLSGEARLVRGYYGRDLISLSALTTPERAVGPAAEGGLPLSVRALLDDNLVIRTSQARMRVGGALTIRGTTAAPVVLGVIEARDGTLILRGQRYQLERAVVRFADPRRIDPSLDVTATTHIREYDITMRVTGRVRDLDMRLTSSPSLPRDQLLSLVAFGSTSAETGQAAGGAFAGEAASLVIRELLDLSGTDSSLPSPLRTIMERTRVSYTSNSEDVGRFGVRIEYEVTGPFLLAGERTSLGYYLIDGVVRLRFR